MSIDNGPNIVCFPSVNTPFNGNGGVSKSITLTNLCSSAFFKTLTFENYFVQQYMYIFCKSAVCKWGMCTFLFYLKSSMSNALSSLIYIYSTSSDIIMLNIKY